MICFIKRKNYEIDKSKINIGKSYKIGSNMNFGNDGSNVEFPGFKEKKQHKCCHTC